MAGYLRQSTASQTRALGPFLDSTDFLTPETALTIANTDIKLVVNGGASANKNSGGGTHRVNGVYGVTFDATDTATVGEMEVSVVVAGALPVFDKFTVLEEAVYDALFAASSAGYQAPIWATAGSTVNLSATTIKAVTDAVALPSSATIAITGNLTGSVGSVTGSVGSVTGAVGSVTDVSNIVSGPIAVSAGIASADVKKVNAVTVTGNGQPSSEWGPA